MVRWTALCLTPTKRLECHRPAMGRKEYYERARVSVTDPEDLSGLKGWVCRRCSKQQKVESRPSLPPRVEDSEIIDISSDDDDERVVVSDSGVRLGSKVFCSDSPMDIDEPAAIWQLPKRRPGPRRLRPPAHINQAMAGIIARCEEESLHTRVLRGQRRLWKTDAVKLTEEDLAKLDLVSFVKY